MATKSHTTTTPAFAPAANRFHNLSNEMFADEIGRLDAQSKAIEADLKAAKDTFKARGIASAMGERFAVSVSEAIRWTLDSAAVKAALGEKWVTAHSKYALVSTLRISASTAGIALAA